MITLHTNLGDIKLELDFEKTPGTAENFTTCAKAGFYNGTIFHRVIDNFMVQGGGFDADMKPKKSRGSIDNEADAAESNTVGTVAMARTSDPHSATTQFFINTKDNKFLDYSKRSTEGWGYCVFAKVVEGMDVVEKIQKVETGSRAGYQDVPVEDVVIESVDVEEIPAEE